MTHTKTKEGYTPGPWMIGAERNTIWTGDSMASIATCHASDARTLGQVVDNARLIASAPELLSSLQEIVLHMGVISRVDMDKDTSKAIDILLDRGKQAIAKATEGGV